MAKPAVHKKTTRVNVLLGEEIHAFGKEKGKDFGGFGPYVERLIIADMHRKNSIAHRHGRTGFTAEAVK